jgi:hypothetical protein
MKIEKAIEVLKMENELMQFDPMTGEIEPIELQNQDNQDLYNANLIAISALEKQLNGGWVPVDERLPEEYGCYLVAWRPTDLTAEDIIKNTGTVPHYYEMVEYDPDDEALWIGGIEQCDSYEILAWQPLPEPYKEVKHVLSS